VTKLYFSNIPIAVTSDQLKDILYNLLGTTHILKVHKINDFAFIHFTIRKRAEEAFQRLQGLVIMGNVIRIDWGRPIEYSKSHRLGQLPENCHR
ncbi:RRM 6 domain containing protein, partial [Asbolus verrucosus]